MSFTYVRSTRVGKKLMVRVGGRTLHFGDSAMQHFRDRTGIWAHLDHNDPERRRRYLARASGIRNGRGLPTRDDPSTPNYHSIRVLW